MAGMDYATAVKIQETFALTVMLQLPTHIILLPDIHIAFGFTQLPPAEHGAIPDLRKLRFRQMPADKFMLMLAKTDNSIRE